MPFSADGERVDARDVLDDEELLDLEMSRRLRGKRRVQGYAGRKDEDCEE